MVGGGTSLFCDKESAFNTNVINISARAYDKIIALIRKDEKYEKAI